MVKNLQFTKIKKSMQQIIYLQIQYMDSSIPVTKRQELKQKFVKSKKAIETLFKQFHYQQGASHYNSMKKLCACLQNVMNVDSLYDFSKYLNNQAHLPIQLNFKALKYEKFLQIFQDWLGCKEESSMDTFERTQTRKHRNILFKRIFLEQKQTIDDYFQTLSQKKKLKGFDLFQLVTELLSPYYLYEFNSDTQTYFQKINTFQSFNKLIEAYIKNATRIYKKDLNLIQDQSYIRLNQFETLIQFWQNLNPELTLQQGPRINIKSISVQTTPINSIQNQTQTDKEYSKNYLLTINNFLREINMLIQNQNDPETLQSLDRIFQVLKNQKIFVASNNHKFEKKKNKFVVSSQFSETEPIILNQKANIRQISPGKVKTNSPQKIITHNIINSPQKDQDDSKTIYKYLCSHDKLHCLTLSGLQSFLSTMGLTLQNDFSIINNLVSYGYISDNDDISLKQFKRIIRQLMKQNKKFTFATLRNYIATYILSNSIQKTAYFKSGIQTQNKLVLNQSLINRERSFREQSRTTYPLDSDGSNI